METVTKEKIAIQLKEKLGFSSMLCEEITNTIFSEIINLCLNNERIVLPNFGKFQIYNKAKRPGLNLRTKAVIEIGPRKVLRFNPSRSFKEKINSDEFN